MLLTYTAVHWLVLFRLYSTNGEQPKMGDKAHCATDPLLVHIGRLHLWGLLPLFVFTHLLFPFSVYSTRFPFLPLMLTSVYVGFGLCIAFPCFVLCTFSEDNEFGASTTAKYPPKRKKLKAQ